MTASRWRDRWERVCDDLALAAHHERNRRRAPDQIGSAVLRDFFRERIERESRAAIRMHDDAMRRTPCQPSAVAHSTP